MRTLMLAALILVSCGQADGVRRLSPTERFTLACNGEVSSTGISRGKSRQLGNSPIRRGYRWDPVAGSLTIRHENGVEEPFCRGGSESCSVSSSDGMITGSRARSTNVDTGYFEVSNYDSASVEISLSDLRIVHSERRGGGPASLEGSRTEAGTTDVSTMRCERVG